MVLLECYIDLSEVLTANGIRMSMADLTRKLVMAIQSQDQLSFPLHMDLAVSKNNHFCSIFPP